MKKILAIVLALCVACLMFAACGTKTPAPDATGTDGNDATGTDTTVSALQAVKDAGKLVIATSPDFPPFEELKADGSVQGIEIDMLNKICDELGVTLEIQQIEFDSVIPGVQADKFDVGVSGITITEERKESVLFTIPYCVEAQAIVVVEGSEIASKADLEGKAVSVQTGTTADLYCTDNNYEVSRFSANSDAEMALTTGKVDAWVIDGATAKAMVMDYNAQAGGTKLVILDEKMTEEPYALAFNLADEDLVEAVNEILSGMLESGEIETIFANWNQDYTAPSATVTDDATADDAAVTDDATADDAATAADAE